MKRLAVVLSLITLAGVSCRQDMHDQPKVEMYEASGMFAYDQGSRQPPRGTVARGRLVEDDLLYTGKVDGNDSPVYPFPVTAAVLERGRDRYNIFCAPCHAPSGTGDGMIVRRGMRTPPSFFEDRLMQSPPGYFFDIISNGFGAMYSYASRIPVEDRWAIVAYVQTLQFSRQGRLEDLTEAQREMLEGEGQ